MPRLRVLALAALLAAVVVPARSDAATCAAARVGTDGWVRLQQPAGLAEAKVLAVSPRDADRLWVSDGFQVARTADGGCSWRVVATISTFITINAQDEDSYIRQIAVSGEPGRETVWVVEQSGSLVGEPRTLTVQVARDGTDDYVESVGLPRLASARLAVGPAPGRATAVVRPADLGVVGVGTEPAQLWTTTDAGRTWDQGASLPGGFTDKGAATSGDSSVVTWSDDSLLRVDTAGAVDRVALPEPRVATVTAGSALVVLPGGPDALVSGDGGRSFATRPVPQGVGSAAEVPGTPVVGVAGDGRTALWRPSTGAAVDVTPRGLRVTSLTAAGGREPALVGRSGGVLVVLPLSSVGAPARALPARAVTSVSLVVPRQAVPADPELRPATTALVLRPGETRRVRYELRLPPTPGKLDVLFLIDTTGSMQPSIDGLRTSVQRIVNALAASGGDVHLGLADFRDIDSADLGGGSVYRLGQRLAPPGEGLRRALQDLDIGGGGDEPEADTIALTQAVTGRGQTGLVPPGREAGFRQGSTRVIVLITDAPFHTEAPVYPTQAEVLTTLNGAGVKVLGISIGARGLGDLQEVAAGTSTRTPTGGIDCDDDGDTDVPEGEPAVCQLDEQAKGAARLGEPILALLQAVSQPGRVTVTSRGPAVRALSGAVDQVVDLARPQQLVLSADYSCGAGDDGTRLDGTLTAAVGGRDLAVATGLVTCRGVPVPPPPLPPLAVEPEVAQPAAALPAGPPPPPAPVTQAQPAVNPQAAPQPGTVVNANLLATTVEEQQEQLELVLAQQEAESFGEELAMVARARREDAVAARLATATALALATACGLVHWRRREHAQLARAR